MLFYNVVTTPAVLPCITLTSKSAMILQLPKPRRVLQSEEGIPFL